MKTSRATRMAAVLATTAALTCGIAGSAMAATASPEPGIVVAQDATAKLRASASKPGAITVMTAPKTTVTVFPATRSKTTGKPLTKTANAKGSVTFSGLTPGATYSVMTANATTKVTVIGQAGDARNLTVTTTDTFNQLHLDWQHKTVAGQGEVRYRVEASPRGNEDLRITDVVKDTSITLTDLDPEAIYTFRITPFNDVSEGKPTTARMNRSLAEITGRSGSAVELDTASPEAAEPLLPAATPTVAPQAQATPSSGPSSPQPATPRTRTIYVCPDGYSDSGANCTKSMGYTYSTRDYTYTYGKTGTQMVWSRCSSGYTDADGQFHWVEQPHDCQVSQDVYGDIKDPTPAGWTDTGSNWSKKDDAPSGWSDDGSQWVQTADKIAREVAA